MKFVLKTLHKPLLCKLHTISQRSNRSWGWGIVYQNKTWKLNVDSLQLPDNYKARTIKPTMLCKTRPHSFIALHKIIIPWTNWDIIFFQHLLQLRMICAICKQTHFNLVWMQRMRQASENGEEIKQLSTDLGEACEIQPQHYISSAVILESQLAIWFVEQYSGMSGKFWNTFMKALNETDDCRSAWHSGN